MSNFGISELLTNDPIGKIKVRFYMDTFSNIYSPLLYFYKCTFLEVLEAL